MQQQQSAIIIEQNNSVNIRDNIESSPLNATYIVSENDSIALFEAGKLPVSSFRLRIDSDELNLQMTAKELDSYESFCERKQNTQRLLA